MFILVSRNIWSTQINWTIKETFLCSALLLLEEFPTIQNESSFKYIQQFNLKYIHNCNYGKCRNHHIAFCQVYKRFTDINCSNIDYKFRSSHLRCFLLSMCVTHEQSGYFAVNLSFRCFIRNHIHFKVKIHVSFSTYFIECLLICQGSRTERNKDIRVVCLSAYSVRRTHQIFTKC